MLTNTIDKIESISYKTYFRNIFVFIVSLKNIVYFKYENVIY